MLLPIYLIWRKPKFLRHFRNQSHHCIRQSKKDIHTNSLQSLPKLSQLIANGTPHKTYFLQRQISTFTRSSNDQLKIGKFGVARLHNPIDFKSLTIEAQKYCNDAIYELTTTESSLKVLRLIDSLSSTMCHLIDSAELCRNVHNETEWRLAAEKCIIENQNFMESLNTNKIIYQSLIKLSANSAVQQMFTREQQRVTQLFLKDMILHGAELSENHQEKAAILQSQIIQLQQIYTNNIVLNRTNHSKTKYLRIKNAEKSFHVLPSRIRNRIIFQETDVILPLDTETVETVLRNIDSERIRRIVFENYQKRFSENAKIIEEILKLRHELSNLFGFESFAQMTTSTLLVNHPDNAKKFLIDLIKTFKEKANAEFSELKSLKKADCKKESVEFQSWDLQYYMNKLVQRTQYSLDSADFAEYFSLQNVLNGLIVITKKLFNCELKQVQIPIGENWVSSQNSDELLKFELRNSIDNSLVGILWMDLFHRQPKFSGSASFVIDSAHIKINETRGIPKIAIVTSFSRMSNRQIASQLLSFENVEILFHEYGHAMHHLLSNVEFQHLSGTRAEVDFVEVPSHLFEHFVADRRILNLFAKHWKTNHLLNSQQYDSLIRKKHLFKSIETISQAILALTDLEIHSKSFNDRRRTDCNFTASDVFHNLNSRYSPIYTSCNQFPSLSISRNFHLCHYASVYYSYAFCKAYAAAIWETILESDPTDTQKGELIKSQLFELGGSVKGDVILKKLLNQSTQQIINHYLKDQIET